MRKTNRGFAALTLLLLGQLIFTIWDRHTFTSSMEEDIEVMERRMGEDAVPDSQRRHIVKALEDTKRSVYYYVSGVAFTQFLINIVMVSYFSRAMSRKEEPSG
jgi:hypothetical protein